MRSGRGKRRRRRRRRGRQRKGKFHKEYRAKKKYIVTLKSRYESLRLCKLNKQLNCKKIFRSGFTVNAAEKGIGRTNELEDIEDIEEDVVVSKMSYDAVPWHLDRIDQNYLPLDNQLSFNDRDGPQRGERFCIRARYWNKIETRGCEENRFARDCARSREPIFQI